MLSERKIYRNRNEGHFEKKFNTFSLRFSIAVITISFIVLLGWLLNIPVLKSISPYWISMKSNTALSFLLAGISILFQNPINAGISPAFIRRLSV